jgi:hypothetical protein
LDKETIVPDPDSISTNEDQQQVVVDVPGGDQTADAPQFDQSALSRAQSLGFSQEELDAIGPANLGTVLRAADRAMASGAVPQTQQPAFGAGQQPAQIDPMQFAAALELNKDDVDEHVINGFHTLNKHYAGQSVQLMAGIGELLGRMEKMSKTVDRMTFDQHVNGLGEDWHPTLGPPNKRNANELDKLRNQVDLMQQLATAQGQQVPYGEVFQRALGSLYFSQLAQMERNRLNTKVQRGVQRTSERPRSREEEPAQSGQEKAVDRVRQAQMAALSGA